MLSAGALRRAAFESTRRATVAGMLEPRALHGSRSLGGTGLIALFAVSAVSQYAGAALAVNAFASMPAAGVAWMRVLVGAVVLCAWRRPWRATRGQTGRSLLLVLAFGAVLAAMNLSFYLAIDRLPLGTAVAIEFIGPVLVAAIASRARRDALALLLAVIGVISLSEVSIGGSPLGVVFAVTAGMLWALYIVLAHQVARRGLGTTGLAAAMAVGTLVIAPVAAPAALPALGHGAVIAVCVGVGLLSSVVPYVIDQVVLRGLGRGSYALLLSLLPATAALVGVVALRQVPRPVEALGILLVIAAVALRSPETVTEP
jgi:inner membrane transporter RhtA